MPTLRVWLAVNALLIGARPARASCQDGASEGFGECQQYPSCQCSSVTKTCPNGGWYTQYSVDKSKCAGAPTPTPTSTTPTAPRPTPDRPPRKPKSPCDRLKDWLRDQQKVLAAYQDDKLLNRAIRQHWSSAQYDNAVWRQAHGGAPIPPGGAKLMGTDPNSCEIDDYDQGCKTLLDLGLPPQACQIALDHERVHQGQCRNRPSSYDPHDLRQRRDREVEAYRQEIDEIEKELGKSCGPGPNA